MCYVFLLVYDNFDDRTRTMNLKEITFSRPMSADVDCGYNNNSDMKHTQATDHVRKEMDRKKLEN